jgi:hypothetical protein|tara:strand:- start:2376 stop:2564 length:189 start_codon:yes stop_codon:yes gene_type:complete
MGLSITTGSSLSFFDSLPDDVLIELAQNNWRSLELLCAAITVDLQLLKEDSYESTSNRRNLC